MGNPLRIAITIPSLGAGGAEKTLSMLANDLTSKGHTVTVTTLDPQGTASYHDLDGCVELTQLDLAPRRARGDRALAQSIRRVFALRRSLRRSSPDVVVSFLTRMNVLTLLASQGMGVPIIVSERNNPAAQKVNWIWRFLRYALYRRAAAVIALTSEAISFYPPSLRLRGHVIPCAFPVPDQPAPRRGPPLIVAVGRLVEQKGFDLLLHAFALVSARFPVWELIIWGDGLERQKLEALRDAMGLSERVHLPGVTRRPGEWIQDAHIFVLSSRYEGLGNVVGEAMAAGLPVVAFDCNWGPRKFIEHGVSGWLVPSGDISALAEALSKLMGDAPLRDRLAQQARIAMAGFAPEIVMDQWEKLLASLGGRNLGRLDH